MTMKMPISNISQLDLIWETLLRILASYEVKTAKGSGTVYKGNVQDSWNRYIDRVMDQNIQKLLIFAVFTS